MFCSQCGTAVADDASFCHRCGKPVPLVAPESVSTPAQAPVEPIPPDTTKAVKSLTSAALPPIRPFAPSKRQIAVSIALAIILALFYGFLFFDALAGELDTKGPIGSSIFFSALAFRHFWQCLNRRGWVGALVGVAVSLLVLFLGGAISGYVKGQRSDILDQVPHLAALKRNFPEVAEQVRQELRAASKDKNHNPQELAAKVHARFLPATSAALKTTSDAAMLQYAKAKIQQFQEVADSNASDCVSLMLGRLERAPPAAQARIMAGTSKDTTKALQDALVKILNDADAHRNAPAVSNEKRFNALFGQLDVKLKSANGTSAYYFGDDSLNKPAEVRCKAGLLLFKEALNLPEKDRSFMLRALFGVE
jgi:hypothetical protein